MNPYLDFIMLLLVCTTLLMLGSSRLYPCITRVSVQGALVGLLPLIVSHGGVDWIVVVLSLVTIALRAMVFPWLLRRALRDVNVRREIEPFIGYNVSLIAGMAVLCVSFWFSSRLPLPQPLASALVVPVSFFMIFSGLLLIVTRKKALTQVVGYLVLENGIFVFGVPFSHQIPVIFEMGILLDIFVGVFVMGIMVFHIQREFDHIDTQHLSSLKDSQPC